MQFPRWPHSDDKTPPTDRSPNWSAVRESLRRRRHVHDLISRSHGARIHGGAIAEDRPAWNQQELSITEIEGRLRELDPNTPDFWVRCLMIEKGLADHFRSAGVDFPAWTN